MKLRRTSTPSSGSLRNCRRTFGPRASRICGLLVAISLSVASSAVCPNTAYGQTAYAIPETPAFTFLNTNPSTITRPTTPRAFGTQLLSGIDAAGRVQQGIALDLAPWSLIPGVAIPLKEYQEDLGSFILANTQLSLGTIRSAADTAATDLAIGLRLTLWDGTDPMRDASYASSLRAKQRECADDHLRQPGGAALFESCIDEFLPQRRKDWLAENWNQPALSLAFAGGWRLSGSQIDQGSWMGFSTWLTGALPLTRHGQLVAEVRYDNRQLSEDDRNAIDYGTRVLIGTPRFNLFAELSGRSFSGAAGTDDDFTAEWAAGIEFQASEDLWIITGLGKGLSIEDAAEDEVAVIAGVRLQVSQAPRIGQLIDEVRRPIP